MRKKYIQLGAVVMCLILMSGALFLLTSEPESTDGESSAAGEKIYVTGGEDAALPASAEIKNDTGNYTLVNDGGKFLVKDWAQLSLDSYALAQAENGVKALEAKQTVAENAAQDDLKAFGLDEPRVSVKIAGGAELLFGDDAPGGEGVYAKRSNDNTVYLVRTTDVEAFFKPRTAYINKAVTATDTEFKGFESVTISGADYPEPVIIRETPETAFEAGGMSFNTHRIVSPVNSGIDMGGLDAINSVYGLIAQDVAAVGDDAETLESYGLNAPAGVISVTGAAENPDMTFELRISAPSGDGMLYLKKSGSPVIYLVDAGSLPWLKMRLFDFMEKMAAQPGIGEVETVTVTAGTKEYRFSITGEGDSLAAALDGKELDIDNFKQYYRTLIAVQYDAEADETPEDGATPLAQVEYRYRSGKSSDVLRFYAGPSRRSIVTVNGGRPYLCVLAHVDRIIEDAAKVAAGETVKSYF